MKGSEGRVLWVGVCISCGVGEEGLAYFEEVGSVRLKGVGGYWVVLFVSIRDGMDGGGAQ